MIGELGFICLKNYYLGRNQFAHEKIVNTLISGRTIAMDYFLEKYITVGLSENPNLFGEDRNILLELLYSFKDFLSEQNTSVKIEKYSQLCQDYANDEFKNSAVLVFLRRIFQNFVTENSAFYAHILRAYVGFMLKQFTTLDIAQHSETEIVYSLTELIMKWGNMRTYEDEISKVVTIWTLLAMYINIDQCFINEYGQSIFSLLTEEQLRLLND